MTPDNNNNEYYLSSEDAQPILDDILRSCHLVPNSLPLDVLQENATQTLNTFRYIRIICMVSILLCFILPFSLLKPSLEIFPAVASGEQTYLEFSSYSLLPLTSVEATLNGNILPVDTLENNTYRIYINEAGELTVTVTALNKEKSISSVDVAPLHLKPEITGSYPEGDTIVITLKAGSYPIDFSNIYGLTSLDQKVYPIAVNKTAQTVTFAYPSEELNIYIHDTQGSSVVAILNVFHTKGELR